MFINNKTIGTFVELWQRMVSCQGLEQHPNSEEQKEEELYYISLQE